MTAVERVELSRACLRSAMLPAAPAADASRQHASFLDTVREIPIIGVVAESMRDWWAHHPLHAVGEVVVGASAAAVVPLARRHPYALVLIAGAVAAALVWRRPWRWLFSSAVFAGLLPRLASRAIAKLPLDAWIAMLSASLSQPQPQPQRQPNRPGPDVAPVAPGNLP
jgi:hypothetical protein